ncbi:MAG TPA: EamA family transporter [Pseudonocardiaceae bacterium]|nr:EamA family transporter [Pseudonocardiaceae bacterium]
MSRRGWVLFALMAVIWGLPYVLIKIADGGVSPYVIVFARTSIGAVVLVGFALRRGNLALLRQHWLPLLGLAVTEILGPWLLLSDAERRLPSSLTGLLIASVPIIGALLGQFAARPERLSPLRWFGLLLGFAGVAVLAGPNLSGGNLWSVAEVLITAVSYAIAPRIAASKLGAVPGPLTSASCLGFAALVYLPAALLTWPHTVPATRVLLALGCLGLVCTAIAFLVFFALIRAEGPAKAMVFTYLNPAVAVVAGALILNEPITLITILAFVLILAGSVLATLHRTRNRTLEPLAQPAA